MSAKLIDLGPNSLISTPSDLDGVDQVLDIINNGGGTPVPYDHELEYVTFPAGSYVDPEVEDYGGFMRYDIECVMRLPSDFDINNHFFRCGNWRGAQTNSFMLWPRALTGDMRVCQEWNLTTSSMSQLILNQFFKVGTQRGSVIIDDTYFSTNSPDFNIQNKASFIIGGLDDATTSQITINTVQCDFKYFKFITPVITRTLIPVSKNGVGYFYDSTKNKLYGSETEVALVPGPDKVSS